MVGRFCGGKWLDDICCLGDDAEEAGRGMLGEVGMRGDMPRWSTRSFWMRADMPRWSTRADVCGSSISAMPSRAFGCQQLFGKPFASPLNISWRSSATLPPFHAARMTNVHD